MKIRMDLLMAIFVFPIVLDISSCVITHYQDNLFRLDEHAGNYQTDSIDDNPIYKAGYDYRVLFMGDSRSRTGETFSGLHYEVYNLGVGASTTWSIRNKLHRVEGIDPNIVFIFTGINDRKYMSPDEFYDNLLHISTFMKAHNIECVILDQTIRPTLDSASKAELFPYGEKMKTTPYTTYLPIAYTDDCFIDGYWHLNAKGYALVVSEIEKYLN
jgi:lysophospholipase L1-like esterase